ncbi:MAG: hypothetical protein SW833_28875 [Cyanobacteriota bacterium]|nr:hypothetical protein [Cyanobacteriota bacterium]
MPHKITGGNGKKHPHCLSLLCLVFGAAAGENFPARPQSNLLRENPS